MISVALPLPLNGQYQTQWDYVLSNFEPDHLFVFGDESEAPSTNVFSRLNASYVRDCSELPMGHSLVVLASDSGIYVTGDSSLLAFEHPTNAIYVFGHDSRPMDEAMLGGRTPDHKVFVDTDTIDDMWSWVAYGCVAWDRRMKANG